MVSQATINWRIVRREELDRHVILLVETDGNNQYCANLLYPGFETEVPGLFGNVVEAAASAKALFRRLNPPGHAQ